jgi:hypothetical protein
MKVFFAGLLLLLSSTAIAGTVNDSVACQSRGYALLPMD